MEIVGNLAFLGNPLLLGSFCLGFLYRDTKRCERGVHFDSPVLSSFKISDCVTHALGSSGPQGLPWPGPRALSHAPHSRALVSKHEDPTLLLPQSLDTRLVLPDPQTL